LIQLRHIRASIELSAFNEALELWSGAGVREGFPVIPIFTSVTSSMIMRRKRGRQLYVSLEYLANRARHWQQRYPDALQLGDWQRLPNPDVWSSTDRLYRRHP
jgi:hypothetical protein